MNTSFPSKLGRYQIIKHLANGGMAQVLVARATGIEGFERHVVVKRIHSDRAEDPVFVKMFLDEARLAAQLHHNNIVQVHDIGKEKGEYFFAMEYVHGEDLRKLLMRLNKKKEHVPFEHIVTIITTAALALHHAHEHCGPDRKPLGLVHRDVSPANIIVGYDGNVKVVDFGIAKAALRSKPEDTKGGSLKGKVSYMAPEQCAGQQVDRRSDVFALGIVLFELSTVRRLFKAANDFLTMSAIVQGQVPVPSSLRPDMPPELEGIIMKALAIDPDERYQNADEMREALEQFAATNGLRMSTGALANYMKQVFGVRPEPWLVEEPLELEMTVDFDGEEEGAARVSEQLAVPSLLVEPTPSSPISRARKKAATDANALFKNATAHTTTPRPQLPPPNLARNKTPPPTLLPTSDPVVTDAKSEDLTSTPDVPFTAIATPEPAVSLVPKHPVLPEKLPDKAAAPPKDDGWTNGSPTTGSGTPLAWPTDVTGTTTGAPRKKLLAIGGGLLAAIGLVVVVFAMRGSGDGNEGAAAHQPAPPPSKIEAPPAAHVVEPPPPPPIEPPPIEPPAIEQAVVELPKDPPPVVAAGSGSGEVKKVIKKKKPKEQWNPDELFLPEKKK